MNENVVECMECYEWKCSWLYEMHNYLDGYGLNWFQMDNEMDMGFGYGFKNRYGCDALLCLNVTWKCMYENEFGDVWMLNITECYEMYVLLFWFGMHYGYKMDFGFWILIIKMDVDF